MKENYKKSLVFGIPARVSNVSQLKVCNAIYKYSFFSGYCMMWLFAVGFNMTNKVYYSICFVCFLQ